MQIIFVDILNEKASDFNMPLTIKNVLFLFSVFYSSMALYNVGREMKLVRLILANII